MTQSRQVADEITRRTGLEVELVEVTTPGDTSTAALAQIGGTGVFVGALREALLDGRVDLAVHSLKDLPTGAAEGIVLAAVPVREDPRDALVARDGLTLGELPSGSRVGTGSPRRAAQLRALGLDLEVVAVRGNVDTRLRLVEEGTVDAVVLARAGLARLGRLGAVTEVIDPLQMLPAPGQGALAVECRAPASAPDSPERPDLPTLLSELDDAATRLAVTAERTLLATLEAGCSAPVGAYGEAAEGELVPELYLRAIVVAVDGSASVRLSATGPLDEAARIGRDLATELLAEGAADLMWERVT
jgi:hydroxymethylbilane synthase